MQKICKFLSIILILSSCASSQKDLNTQSNSITLENNYPELFEVSTSIRAPIYSFKADPTTLQFDCTKRTDGQPYYYCSIRGKFFASVQKHPKYFSLIYMSSRSIELVNIDKQFLDDIRKDGEVVTLMATTSSPSIVFDKENKRNKFLFPLFGIQSSKRCLNWFNDFSGCPKGAKHYNY